MSTRPSITTGTSYKRSDRSPTRGETDNYRERSNEREDHDDSRKKEGNKSTKLDDDDIKELENDKRGRKLKRQEPQIERIEPEEPEENDSQLQMMKLMGFGSFETTKNKHVDGIGKGSAKKNKKAQYRQYMNRDKGFNRALSPERKKK